MGKFYGKIGYSVNAEESSPGVWTSDIVEKGYMGDVLRNAVNRRENSSSINDNFTINNSISIVADAYAYENFHQITYVVYMGTKWTVTSVEVQRPRLILSLGGVYNA